MSLEMNTDEALRDGIENATSSLKEEQVHGYSAMATLRTWLEGDPE